jgi:hypothetical protein
MRFNLDFAPDPLSEIESKFGPRFAKLVEGQVIPCSLEEWCAWKMEEGDAPKIVARDETETHLISTVFLGPIQHRAPSRFIHGFGFIG